MRRQRKTGLCGEALHPMAWRSKSDAFPPLELHYAETCIVPQAAGDYEIYSPDGSEVKVILACVRN